MTYQEAKIRQIEMLKIDIRNRLHKYNPDKYPKVKSYSAVEAVEVSMTLVFTKDRVKSLFERDSVFYKRFLK